MDFGIARAVSDSAATMTSTAAVIGTAQYLSPEQARGEGVDARSDVYSMGCLLYELCTGAPPFTGDSPVSVAYQHVREDPRLPSSINPRVPPELDAIVLKAMSKNPANRYQSAADMRTDLLRALNGQRVEATPVMGDAEKTTILGAVPAAYGRPQQDQWDDEDDEAAARRKRRIIAIVGVVALLLIAGVIALAMSLGGTSKPPVTPVAKVPVPSVVHQDQAAAVQALTTAGLQTGTITMQSTDTPADVGKVLDSNPTGGSLVVKGTKVDLTVGKAPDTVAVPPVVNLTVDQARTALKSAGFTGNVNTDKVDSLKPAGTVIAVDPKEGSQVPLSQSISLQVSSGKAAIPDVHGKSQADAQKTLRDAGFTNVVPQDVENDTVPQGSAVGTEPGAGTSAGADTPITLLIAVPTPPAASSTAATSTASSAPASKTP
jgi:serine/threonine-protein kinase